MPGAPGICVCFQGGAQQFEGRLKKRGRKKDRQRSKEGEKMLEKEVSSTEANKTSECYSCVLFIYS